MPVLSHLYLAKLNIVIFTFKKTNMHLENVNEKSRANYFQEAIMSNIASAEKLVACNIFH